MLKELRRVFKDTVIYGMGSLLPKAAGLILMPIYTRVLSTADYGIYSLSMMIASMVGVVMALGQPGSLTLHLRHKIAEEGETRDLLFTVVTFVMGAGALMLGVLYLLGPALVPHITKNGELTFAPYVILALLIAYAGLPLAMQQAVNRAKGQAKTHTLFQLAQFTLNTAFTLYFVVALRQGPAGSLKGTLTAALLVAPVALIMLAKQMRPRFSMTWLKASLRFGLPLVPHYFAGWLLAFADRALLARLGTMSDVGLYSVAYNLSMALNLFSTAINQAWGPIYYDLSDSDEGRAMLPRLTSVYAAAVAGIAMAFTLLAPEALPILAAPAFAGAKIVIPLVAAGYFFFALYMVLSTPIFYAKKTKYVPLVSGAAAVLNIALNLWWIPLWGMMGAAAATLVAYAFMAGVSRTFSGRLRPGAFEDSRLVRIIVVYFVSVAAAYGIMALELRPLASIPLALAALAGCIGLLFVMGVVTRDEVRQMIERVRSRTQRKQRAKADEAALEAREAEAAGASPDASGFDPDDQR
ncbi:MAG: oligosaccharide flippase family protein [Coriobacteriia bacterium]|nr:oligosaccharide flippase family protein [Coriobacteriia bacterium]